MSRIIQLDPLLANQIAAGEVVERPASVIKELVENSVDAGATKIEIEVEGGGTRLIRVRDDGKGIARDDLALAFSRHATSKIQHIQDLTTLCSLGFRGEALASIAAVSRCQLLSRKQGEEASHIQIFPDLSFHIKPVAHPIGTTVEVSDLFYNTPARRRFLRSEKTEFQAIEEMVKRLVLSRPDISFRLTQQGRERYYPRLSSTTCEQTRVAKVCGQAFIEKAFAFSGEASGLGLTGWLGSSFLNRRQADCQYFFVNGRIVKDRLLNHAIKSVYQAVAHLEEGTYPSYILYLTLDPKEIDVNVHPTKQEVRFGQARLVHDFVAKCIQQGLKTEPVYEATDPCRKYEKSEEKIALKAPAMAHRYVLLEEGNGDVLILDCQRAKNEILTAYFEKYQGAIPTQSFLFPHAIAYSPLLHLLSPLGFECRIEEEKKQAFLIKQPAILIGSIEPVIKTLIDALKASESSSLPLLLATYLPWESVTRISRDILATLLSDCTLQEKSTLRLTQTQIAAMLV